MKWRDRQWLLENLAAAIVGMALAGLLIALGWL